MADGSARSSKKTIWIVIAILLGFVLIDVIVFWDLFESGSPEELEHASERVNDLLTGPNAP